MKTIAEIKLWGRTIGAVSLEGQANGVCAFEYAPDFQSSGIELAPLMMPLSDKIHRFPALSRDSFHGLPGLVADSLPDKFGNALIDAWLATRGRTPDSFNAIERLCYIGTRGMGALEFEPASHPSAEPARPLQMDRLVEMASSVLSHRDELHTRFGKDDAAALSDILQLGTSAGGARAKAVIAWNPKTGELKSGEVSQEDKLMGFEYWLLKFDGVKSNQDKELDDPKGFSAIEYAYSLMAREAGIEMMPCRVMEENGRRHFLTKRFDRTDSGQKIHMQSLCAMAHYDFNMAGYHSYEQCFLVMRQLGLNMAEIEQQFRRMAFNIVARNQDDHVKNITFLMDKEGEWKLSPAYDITYSYNPTGRWTSSHQMSMNGKQEYFSMEDFIQCGKVALMKRGRAQIMVREVIEVVSRWPVFASEAEVDRVWSSEIAQKHRLHF